MRDRPSGRATRRRRAQRGARASGRSRTLPLVRATGASSSSEHGRRRSRKAADAEAQRSGSSPSRDRARRATPRGVEPEAARNRSPGADDRLEEAAAATDGWPATPSPPRNMPRWRTSSVERWSPASRARSATSRWPRLPEGAARRRRVAAAEKALAKAEARSKRDRAREKERASPAAVGAATTAVERSREAGSEEAAALLEASTVELRGGRSRAHRATHGPARRMAGRGRAARTLLEAREAELEAAERRRRRRRRPRWRALARPTSEQRERADAARGRRRPPWRWQLAGVWGGLGEHRDVRPRPPTRSARPSWTRGEAVVRRHDEAGSDRRRRRHPRDRRSPTPLADVLRSLGLEPDEDFVQAQPTCGAAHARRHRQGRRTLERDRAVPATWSARSLEAEARRALARRLADDLKPSRFLAFLLGGGARRAGRAGQRACSRQLTDGDYRFAADDSFDILDLNAAGQAAQSRLALRRRDVPGLAGARPGARRDGRAWRRTPRLLLPGRGVRLARPRASRPRDGRDRPPGRRRRAADWWCSSATWPRCARRSKT